MAVPEVCEMLAVSGVLVVLLLEDDNFTYESPVVVPKDVSHPFQTPRASELRTP